jgi:hypothetical protein
MGWWGSILSKELIGISRGPPLAQQQGRDFKILMENYNCSG